MDLWFVQLIYVLVEWMYGFNDECIVSDYIVTVSGNAMIGYPRETRKRFVYLLVNIIQLY